MADKAQDTKPQRRRAPARSVKAQEDRLYALAVDLVEQRLIDGTATAQEVTHLLREGSLRRELENEKLKRENEFLRAKAEHLEATKTQEQLYKDAIEAFKRYNGYQGDPDEEL